LLFHFAVKKLQTNLVVQKLIILLMLRRPYIAYLIRKLCLHVYCFVVKLYSALSMAHHSCCLCSIYPIFVIFHQNSTLHDVSFSLILLPVCFSPKLLLLAVVPVVDVSNSPEDLKTEPSLNVC